MQILPVLLTSLMLMCPDVIKTYDISWLMMEIPEFRNAPDFNLIQGLNGQIPIGDSQRQDDSELRKSARQKVEQLLSDIVGDDEKVTWSIWQKTLIVRYR
jgi:hypothetical protein